MLILSSGKTCIFLWLWVWNAGYPELVGKGSRKKPHFKQIEGFWCVIKEVILYCQHWGVWTLWAWHWMCGCGMGALRLPSSLRIRCLVGSDAATQGGTGRWGWRVGSLWWADDSSFGQHWGLQAILFYDTEHILKSGLEWSWGLLVHNLNGLSSAVFSLSALFYSVTLVVIFICRQNSILWIVFQECLRHVIVEKECWSDLPLSWSWWRLNTTVCDKEGCVGLDLTQREVLLFQRNIYCLVFPSFLFWLPVELFFFYSSQLAQGLVLNMTYCLWWEVF